MNEQKVNRYYKVLSLFALILGAVLLHIPSEMSVSEKIKFAIAMNIALHAIFHFTKWVPLELYKGMKDNSFSLQKKSIKIMIGFSVITIIVSVFGFLQFLYFIIRDGFVEGLLFLPIFSGMFLGGYASKLKLRMEKSEPSNTE